MDITEYLQRTSRLDEPVDYSSAEGPLLDWLDASATELGLDVEVVPTSTFDESHRFVPLSGEQYLVWDTALNRTVFGVIVSLQYARMANSEPDADRKDRIRTFSESILRKTLFVYLSRKLRAFSYTSKAFGWLAEECGITGKVAIPQPEAVHEIFDMQRMLMFYHELSHAYFNLRPDLFAVCRERTIELLKGATEIWSEGITPEDVSMYYPEFASLDASDRLGRYVEELACDYQGFILVGMALPNAPSIPTHAWQDSIGFLFGASTMLAQTERFLKQSTVKWMEFARATADCAELPEEALDLPDFFKERAMFLVRRWNCALALQSTLTRLGTALNVDAFKWQEYIIEKFSGMNETLEEHTLQGLNALSTPEFIAKLYARGQFLRTSKRS
jgi:hypothetical protein